MRREPDQAEDSPDDPRAERPVGPWLEPLRLALRAHLARLPEPMAEFILFGLKQAWACLFAGLMLALLIASKLVWQAGWPIHRYDALFVAAILIQGSFLACRLETFEEARVILAYHVVGTVMEIFKTHVGSWSYPEAAFIRIGGVPLFSGFMYASVGSYMVRVMRICDMRFEAYPRRRYAALLAGAIYLNFFTHHYVWDMRCLLFAWSALLFWPVTIHYRLDRQWHRMPYLLAAVLTALFLWIAENVGTITGTWLYPGHDGWSLVSLQKLGAWYLLLIVSFAIVTLLARPRPPDPEMRRLTALTLTRRAVGE